LDDATKKRIAREAVAEAVWQLSATRGGQLSGVELVRDEDSEPTIIFETEIAEGLGSIQCRIKPLAAVEKIVADCDSYIEKFELEVQDPANGEVERVRFEFYEWEKTDREQVLKTVAVIATYTMLGSWNYKTRGAFVETYQDALLLTKIVTGKPLSNLLIGHEADIEVDARTDIEKLISKAADARRSRLADAVKNFPHVLLSPKRGRPPMLKKRVLLDAMDARRAKGEPTIAKGLALDLDKDVSAVRKAAKRHEIELDPEE
jgi:hypothetical protein